MSSAFDRCAALLLACAGMVSVAHAENAPADLLGDPAGLQKQALARAIGRPVYVLTLEYGAQRGELLVQDRADPEIYDEYAFGAGTAIVGPKAVKVGSVDCKKSRQPLEAIDFAAGARVLAAATALAQGNGYSAPTYATLGPDIFCNGFNWRFMQAGVENDDVYLELVYAPDGKLKSTRQFDGERWRKLSIKKLAQNTARPATKPPEPVEQRKPGGTADWNFYADVRPALAELERFIGEPLRMKLIAIGDKSLSVELFKRNGGKRAYTYIVRNDGEISLFNEMDPIPFDCNKPFTLEEAQLGRLAAQINTALHAIPPMQDPYVTSVHVSRTFGCGRMETKVFIEDQRAKGTVVFNAAGRITSAEIN